MILVGIQLLVKSKLNATYSISIIVSTICLILAVISIVAVFKKQVRFLRFYFIWKVIELVLIPLIQVFTIMSSDKNQLT
jgi:hypothetical protein